MKSSHPPILSLGVAELFEEILGKDRNECTALVLKSLVFLDPTRVRANPVQYQDSVRTSNEHHPGKTKKEKSLWEGREVVVHDNTRARLAIGRYLGLKTGGKDRDLPIGWEVGHVWGRVYDPEYFTAGWNLFLVPSFLRCLLEEQTRLGNLPELVQVIAHRLYFDKSPVATPKVIPMRPQIPWPDYLAEFSPTLV